MIPVESFNEACLKDSPVWAWDDSGDYVFPVGQRSPLPTDLGELMIEADFVAPSGMHLRGVVNNPPGEYSISLFVGNQVIHLNSNLPSVARAELGRLFDLLGVQPFDLFPLRYETQFHFPGKPNIAGVFSLEAAG